MRAARAVEPKQGNLDLLGRRVDVEDPPRRSGSRARSGRVSRSARNRAFDDFEVRRVEPIAERGRPVLVLEVERKSTRICRRQALDLIRGRDSAPCRESSGRTVELRLVTSSGSSQMTSESWWTISGRKVVVEVFLEDSPHEIDGLVQRVHARVRIKFGPERVEHLISRAAKSGRVSRRASSASTAGECSSRESPSAPTDDGHSPEVLDVDSRRQAPRKAASEF